jgi:hypothetical protein
MHSTRDLSTATLHDRQKDGPNWDVFLSIDRLDHVEAGSLAGGGGGI